MALAVTVAAGTYSAVHGRSIEREQKRIQTKALVAREKEFNAQQDFFQQAANTTQANAQLAQTKNAQAAAALAAQGGGGLLWLVLGGAAVLIAFFFLKRKG